MRVLREREFRLLWLGQSASTIGDRLVFVALALYVTEIGTPTDVGIVLAAHAIPLVALPDARRRVGGPAPAPPRDARHRPGPRGDARAARGADLHRRGRDLDDRGDRGRLRRGRGVLPARRSPAWCRRPCPRTMLQDANAATSIVETVAEFAGPALATALVLGVGAGWAFAFDAATFLVSAFFLVRMRPRARGERAAAASVLTELRAGWARVPRPRVGVGDGRDLQRDAAGRARAVLRARPDRRRGGLRRPRASTARSPPRSAWARSPAR